MKAGEMVAVNLFAEHSTRRGTAWNCRVLEVFRGGVLSVEPIETTGGVEAFFVRKGEYRVVQE